MSATRSLPLALSTVLSVSAFAAQPVARPSQPNQGKGSPLALDKHQAELWMQACDALEAKKAVDAQGHRECISRPGDEMFAELMSGFKDVLSEELGKFVVMMMKNGG